MARTTLTPVVANGPYPTTGVSLPLVAMDTVNLNQFASTGKELLVVQNTDVGAQTVTVNSVANAKNRTGDITAYSIPASGFAILGPFAKKDWAQSNGFINCQGSSANLKVAVIQLPS